MRTTSTGVVLKLHQPSSPSGQATSPTATPKTHPAGVWDLPAAAGYRRLAAIFPDGTLALELNVSERVPEVLRAELKLGVERSLELSLKALKV